MTQPDVLWLDLLREAVAASSQSIVARRLGLSRATISLVLAGKYPGGTGRVAARVLNAFAQLECPHTGETVTPAVCVQRADRRAPVNNPMAMQHWRACQSCAHRPVKPDVKGVHR